jgi:hypothetical protein
MSADASIDLLQQIADRIEITELVYRYGRYADEGIRRSEDLYTDDIVIVSENGAKRFEGLAAVKARGPAEMAGPFARTQHVITNVSIDLHGDRASIRANLIATHLYDLDRPSEYWILKGYYEWEAVRTPKGWRFSRRSLWRVWEEDTRKKGEARYAAPEMPARTA